MNEALLFSALMMGLAGTPHCLAMCGAASTAACGGRTPAALAAFHLGRLVSYALAGAVAAASVGSLAALGQAVGALRPLWTLVHACAFALGLFLLWRGRQPAWLERLGRNRLHNAQAASASGQVVHVVRGPVRRIGLGLAWVAWPCGLLQSALLVASLANGAGQGALVMAVFALASAGGLAAGPWLWTRLTGGAGPVGRHAELGVRLAGLALAAASFWALSHGVWTRVAAWCLN